MPPNTNPREKGRDRGYIMMDGGKVHIIPPNAKCQSLKYGCCLIFPCKYTPSTNSSKYEHKNITNEAMHGASF